MHFNNGPKKAKFNTLSPQGLPVLEEVFYPTPETKEKHKSESCVNKAFTNVCFLSLAKPLIVASIPRSTILSQPQQHICTAQAFNKYLLKSTIQCVKWKPFINII